MDPEGSREDDRRFRGKIASSSFIYGRVTSVSAMKNWPHRIHSVAVESARYMDPRLPLHFTTTDWQRPKKCSKVEFYPEPQPDEPKLGLLHRFHCWTIRRSQWEGKEIPERSSVGRVIRWPMPFSQETLKAR